MPRSIREVKREHESRLMALPGVVSVGIGLDKDRNPAIRVGLDGPRPKTEAKAPRSLQGYPVEVYVIGKVRAQ